MDMYFLKRGRIMDIQNLSEYLEYLEVEKGLSTNTIEAYRRDLESFLEMCEALNINDVGEITRNQINAYILNLRENQYSPSSVMRKTASLRGFFKWLCANEVCATNPTLTLEQPKIPKRLPKVMSLAEIEEILHEDLTKIERLIIELLYGCGLRVSELTELKINDIDFNSSFLRCRGKGSKERLIPLGIG